MKNQTNNTRQIFANATIVKLQEYSKAYGAPKPHDVPFIIEENNQIHLCSDKGSVYRTMRKGTKVLV